MTGARTDYAIIVAIVGILLAGGIPAINRGHLLIGGSLVAMGIGILGWAIVLVWQERRSAQKRLSDAEKGKRP